jgi:hypothetical protein
VTATITPEELYFGAPASLTYGGVECGATVDAPKVAFEVTTFSPEFQNAKGPIKGTVITTKVIPSCEFTVNQITAQKLAWAMPGSASLSSQSVGQVRGELATTLGADPALGATIIRLASVTTVADNEFIRIGAAGVAATEANSEVVKVTTVGTAGGTDTVVENSAGGGLLIDHASGAEAKTVTGTILAAPCLAGATNIKVDSVTGLAPLDFVRIGYVGHYEIRQLSAVGTTGPSGTGLTFLVPLTRDHGLDEWVIEVTTLGGTTITWDPGRIASGSYQTLILTGIGLDGRQMIVTLFNAMSAESQELEFGDAAVSGLKVKFAGYYDPSTPNTAPFNIQLT